MQIIIRLSESSKISLLFIPCTIAGRLLVIAVILISLIAIDGKPAALIVPAKKLIPPAGL
jgi:hypothetical protein